MAIRVTGLNSGMDTDAMVKECVYRGFCPEFQPCGYCFTEEYRKELEAYRSKSKWAEMKSKIESNAEQV